MTDHTMTIYVAQVNADLTEGRGPMRDVGYYTTDEAALDSVRGKGVMGVGNGDVESMTITVTDGEKKIKVERKRVYGYHKSKFTGQWRDGWLDGRDLPESDPEWADYQRLRKKFGDI